jgi:hypothetical protein
MDLRELHLHWGESSYRGRRYRSYALARAYREDGKNKKEVVLKLGKLSDDEAERWKLLLRAAKRPDATITTLEDVVCQAHFDFLDVAVVNAIWDEWRLDDVFPAKGKKKVDIAAIARILTINRCLDPLAKSQVPRWFQRSALPALLQIKADDLNPSRIFRELEAIEDCKEQIASHVYAQIKRQKPGALDKVFYDLSSSVFHGSKCTLVKWGRAKDGYDYHAVIALVVDKDGVPFYWEVLPAGTSDAKTIEWLLKSLKTRFAVGSTTLVFDRGMVSDRNLSLLEAENIKYISALDKPQIEETSGLEFKSVLDWNSEDIEARVAAHPRFQRFDDVTYYRDVDRHLDDSSHGELLAKAQGLGKRELETLLSGIAPRPPQRDVIRPIAAPKPKALPAAALKFDAPADEEKEMTSTGAATGETPPASRCDALPERQVTPLRLAGMTSDACTTRQTPPPAPPELVQISFTAKAELAKKLRRAQDLLAHRLPDGRLEDVFDAALQALLERVDPLLRAKRRAAREEKRRQQHDDTKEQSQTSSCPGASRAGDARTQTQALFDTAAQQAPSSQDRPCPATPPSTDAQAQAPLDPPTPQSRTARRRSFPAAERYACHRLQWRNSYGRATARRGPRHALWRRFRCGRFRVAESRGRSSSPVLGVAHTRASTTARRPVASWTGLPASIAEFVRTSPRTQKSTSPRDCPPEDIDHRPPRPQARTVPPLRWRGPCGQATAAPDGHPPWKGCAPADCRFACPPSVEPLAPRSAPRWGDMRLGLTIHLASLAPQRVGSRRRPPRR